MKHFIVFALFAVAAGFSAAPARPAVARRAAVAPAMLAEHAPLLDTVSNLNALVIPVEALTPAKVCSRRRDYLHK